jgi:uncharacterized membrane-anchored protein YhcB (DUF1043 family)
MEALTLLAGIFIGYMIARTSKTITVKIDAQDAIKQLKDTEKAVELLKKDMGW